MLVCDRCEGRKDVLVVRARKIKEFFQPSAQARAEIGYKGIMEKRLLIPVVDQMVALLSEQTSATARNLRDDLLKWEKDVFLILPEDEARHWRDVADILYQRIPEQSIVGKEPWVKVIAEIWKGNMIVEHTTLSQYDVALRGGAVVTVRSRDDLVKVFRDHYKEQDAVLVLGADADGQDAVLVVREIAAVVKTGEGST